MSESLNPSIKKHWQEVLKERQIIVSNFGVWIILCDFCNCDCYWSINGNILDGLSRQRIWLWMNYLDKGWMDYLDKGIIFWLQMANAATSAQLQLAASLRCSLPSVNRNIEKKKWLSKIVQLFHFSCLPYHVHIPYEGQGGNLHSKKSQHLGVEWSTSDRVNHMK